jgi:hypothetical protein
MNDALKILLAAGVGIYSVLVIHLYSVFIGRPKNYPLRFCLGWLLCFFVFGGGIVGCSAIMGALYDTGQKPTPHDVRMRFFIIITWIGVVWIYLIFNFRALAERFRSKK